MTDHEHDEAREADDGDRHPLTQAKDPFEDDDGKHQDDDDDAWVPPVP
jgi:hypothetical protein